MPSIGPWQVVLILAVLVILFGNRLPSVMRSLGKSVVEFKKGVQGLDEEDGDSEKKSGPKE